MYKIASLLLLALVMVVSTARGDDLVTRPVGRMQSRVALTLGTPAGVNVCGSYWGLGGTGYRLTLGYLPGRDNGYAGGGQLELTFRTSHKTHTVFDWSVGVGYADMLVDHQRHRWTYLGGFATLNSHAFFGQIGLTFGHDQYDVDQGWGTGDGAFSSPQLFLQIGISLTTGRCRL